MALVFLCAEHVSIHSELSCTYLNMQQGWPFNLVQLVLSSPTMELVSWTTFQPPSLPWRRYSASIARGSSNLFSCSLSWGCKEALLGVRFGLLIPKWWQIQVVKAAQGRVPVFLDGGVRRGTDVFKALALGASGIFVSKHGFVGRCFLRHHVVDIIARSIVSSIPSVSSASYHKESILICFFAP